MIPRTELLARVKDVVAYAEKTIRRIQRDPAFWRNEGDPIVRLGDKIVIETCVLVMLLSRLPERDKATTKKLGVLVRQLDKLARSPRVKLLIMRFPSAATALGLSSLALSQAGLPDAQMDALIAHDILSGLADTTEKLPFRAMDARWARSLLNSGEAVRFDDLIPLSLLNSVAHAIYMTRHDAYALTHALMYITDFGRLSCPPEIDASTVAAMIDGAIAWSFVNEDLDLLAELVMAAHFLGVAWSPHLQMGWYLIDRAWTDIGFLPSPTFHADRYTRLSPEDKVGYEIRNVYHTMYVGGLLFAALSQALPTVNVTGDASVLRDSDITALLDDTLPKLSAACSRGATGRRAKSTPRAQTSPDMPLHEVLLARVTRMTKFRHVGTRYWFQSLGDAPLSGPDLTRFLADAVMILLARQYDLRGLAATLHEVVRSDMPLSVTFAESLRFLRRQELAADVLDVEIPARGTKKKPVRRRLLADVAHDVAAVVAALGQKVGRR